MSTRGRNALLILLLACAAAALARLAINGDPTGPLFAFPAATDLWAIRAQRLAIALTVGAGLAVSGLLLQSLLRNPLASPDILGASSGASLAVMLAAAAGGSASAAASAPIWHAGPALLGALAALALVYALSQRRGFVDPAGLILTGVIVSVMCGAGVMLLQHLNPASAAGSMRMLIGAFDDEATWPSILPISALTLAAAVAAFALGRATDAAALADDEALSVGVPLPALRLTLFLLAGVTCAGSVMLAGPVGFVGLIAPHAARLLLGKHDGGLHRPLLLASALAGATLLIAADAAIRALHLGAGRLPIGVVTALAGGPAFIVLLRRTR